MSAYYCILISAVASVCLSLHHTATTPPTQETTTPPACSNGKIYNTCGSACPLTCDSPEPRPCTRNCVADCFCPQGMLENGDTCVLPGNCLTTASPTQEVTTHPACPNGKTYSTCGSPCPLTCDSPEHNVCTFQCTNGCFCPHGMVEYGDICVHRSSCPDTGPCQDVNCPNDWYCEVNSQTNQPECKKAVYVPCTSDVPLACDSEFLRCIVQNNTHNALCLPSCFLDNGNCRDEDTCVVSKTDYGSTIKCLRNSDLPTDCSAGLVINECGAHCQETCDDVLSQFSKVCITVCGPPDCVCPQGLVRYRDRCVDPNECYSLHIYPPEVKPLPSVKSDRILLKMIAADDLLTRKGFLESREDFLGSLRQLLNDNSHGDVGIVLHAVLDGNNNLEIFVELSGGSVSPQTVNEFIDLITTGSLSVPVGQVDKVNIPKIDSRGLSREAIIGIGVGAGVVLFVLCLLMVTILVCCCVLKKKPSEKSVEPSDSKDDMVAFSRLVSEGLQPYDKKMEQRS